jgi:tetratricopeptide (TPR) repeat protein
VARVRKQNATYWLALMYYELGNYPAAVEWLSERTLEAAPPSRWLPGARYNLARCYEHMGDLEAARRWLLSDADSPQRPGNLLRAKWLNERSESADSDPAKKYDSEP